jgi:hypothetical protein
MSKIFPIEHLVTAIVAEEPNPLPPKWKALYMTLLIDIYANHREHNPVVYPQKVVRYNWAAKKSKIDKDGKDVFDEKSDDYFSEETETLREVLVAEFAGKGKASKSTKEGGVKTGLKHPGPADYYDEPGRIATLCANGSPMFSTTSPLTKTDESGEPSKIWLVLKQYLLNTVRIVASNTKSAPHSDCFSAQWAPLTYAALRLTELLFRVGLLCGEDSERIETMPIQAEVRAAIAVANTEGIKKEGKPFDPWALAQQKATVTTVVTTAQMKPNVINYKLEALQTYNRILVLVGILQNNRRMTRVTNFFHVVLASLGQDLSKISQDNTMSPGDEKQSEKQLIDRKMHETITAQLSKPAKVHGKVIPKLEWNRWSLGVRLAQLVFERVETEGGDFKLPTARALLALLRSEHKGLTGQGLTLLNRLYSQRKRLKYQIDSVTIVTAEEATKLSYVNNELRIYYTPAIDRAFGALYEESLDVALDYFSVCSGILRRWSSSININVNDTLNVPGLTTMMDECDEYFGDQKSPNRYPVEEPVERKTDDFPALYPIEMAKRAMCETVVAQEVFTKLLALAGQYTNKGMQEWMVAQRGIFTSDGRISRFFGLKDESWPEGFKKPDAVMKLDDTKRPKRVREVELENFGGDLEPNDQRTYDDPREPGDTGLDLDGNMRNPEDALDSEGNIFKKKDVKLLTSETLKEYIVESLLFLELYIDIHKDNQAEIRDLVLEATESDPKSDLSLFFLYAIDEMGLGPEVSKFYSSLFRGNKKASASLKLRRNIVLVRLLETAAVELPDQPITQSSMVNYCPRHLSFFVDLLMTVGTDAAASLTHQLAIYKIIFPDKKQQEIMRKKAEKEKGKEYIKPISVHYKCAAHVACLHEFAKYSEKLEAERTKLRDDNITRENPAYGLRLQEVDKEWYESSDSSIIGWRRKQLLFYDRILDLAGNLVRGSSPTVQKIEQDVQKWLGDGIKEDASKVLWDFVNLDVAFNIMAFKGPALTFLKEAFLDTSEFRERLQQLRDRHNMTKALLGQQQPDEDDEDGDRDAVGKDETDNTPTPEEDELTMEEQEEEDVLQEKFTKLMQDFAEQVCNFTNDIGEGYSFCKQEVDKNNNTSKNSTANRENGSAANNESATLVNTVSKTEGGQPPGTEEKAKKKTRHLLGKTMSQKPGFTQMHRDGEAVYVFSYIIPFMRRYFSIMTSGDDDDEGNTDAAGQDEAQEDDEEGHNADEDHKRWLSKLPVNLRATFTPGLKSTDPMTAFGHHEGIVERRKKRKEKVINEDFCLAILKLHKMKIKDFIGWKTGPARARYAANVERLVEEIPGINDKDVPAEIVTFLTTANKNTKKANTNKADKTNGHTTTAKQSATEGAGQLDVWETDAKQLTAKWDTFVHILGSFDRDLDAGGQDDDDEMETAVETMTLEESQLVDVLRITAESAMGERVITDTGGNTVQTFEQGFNKAEAVAIFKRLTTYLSIDSQLEDDSELDQTVFFNQFQATNILAELLRTQTWDRDYKLQIEDYSKLENEVDSDSAGRVEQMQELLGIQVPGVELVVHHLSVAYDEAVLSYPLKLELLAVTANFANLLLNNCSRLVQNKVLDSVIKANMKGSVEQYFLSGLCSLLDHHVSQFISSMDGDDITFDERAVLTGSTTQILILLQALCDGQNKAMQSFFLLQRGFEEQVNVILRVVDSLANLFRCFNNTYITQSKKYDDDDALYFNFYGDQLQKTGATASRAFKTHRRKMIKWMNFNKHDVDKQEKILLIMSQCYHTLSDFFEGPNRAVLATIKATRIGAISRQLLDYLGSRLLPSSKFALIGFDGSGSDENKEFTVASRALCRSALAQVAKQKGVRECRLNIAQAPGLKVEVKAVLSPMAFPPVWLDDPVTYVAIHYGRERLIRKALKALTDVDALALEAMRDVCGEIFKKLGENQEMEEGKKTKKQKARVIKGRPPGDPSSWRADVVSETYFRLNTENTATSKLIQYGDGIQCATVETLNERIKAAMSKSVATEDSLLSAEGEEKDEAPVVEIEMRDKVTYVQIATIDDKQIDMPEGYATLRYTIDGADPELDSDNTFIYQEPFDLGKVKDAKGKVIGADLSKTTIVKARYFAEEAEAKEGNDSETTFERERDDMTFENPLTNDERSPERFAAVRQDSVAAPEEAAAKAPSAIGAATYSPMVEAIQGGTTADKLKDSLLRAVAQMIEEAEQELHKDFAEWHKQVGGRARLDPLIKSFAKMEAGVLDMVRCRPPAHPLHARSHTIS